MNATEGTMETSGLEANNQGHSDLVRIDNRGLGVGCSVLLK